MIESPRYGLGLDLGVASLGWAMVELGPDDRPVGLLKLGVRIFEPGVEPIGQLTSADAIARGQDQSHAVKRRQARLARRQIRRRAARRRDLFILLAQNGLLPGFAPGGYAAPEQRDVTLRALDRQLFEKWRDRGPAAATAHLLPCFLRARALDARLEPYELGRVLYHLIQRRGFKSNRKEGRKRKESERERGAVLGGITELGKEIAAAGAPTLGAYFAGLDPRLTKVRRRFTSRDMFEAEFERIWAAQSPHHPTLRPELHDHVKHLLFFQRPISAGKPGRCELEPGQQRAPWATLEAQRFRVLQKVNDLRIDEWPKEPRPLTEQERAQALAALAEGDASFKDLKAKLDLKRNQKFNLARGADKHPSRGLRGETVASLMRTAFGGQRWAAMDDSEREKIVAAWRDDEHGERLLRLAREEWRLDDASAQLLAGAEPEDGYCNLSLKALRRLLPEMEKGLAYKTAELAVYGDRMAPPETGDSRLPPVIKALPEIRNPSVMRSLTELRKVVNALVREHGKPFWVRVELARDLKRSRDDRAELYERNGKREAERKNAAKRLAKIRIENPSRADIDKLLLADECGFICPYSGRNFGVADLRNGQVETEHILPLSLYADDSFANKTLCWRDANQTKGQRTPFQAYGGEEYERIIERVKAWKPGNPGKLARFQLRSGDEVEQFTSRHLNDTRYASRLAARYLLRLYGRVDLAKPDGARRNAVLASSGAVTASLRRFWRLEAILGGELGKGKQRSDHRHHAIDALVIACTSQGVVQAMSAAAAAGFAQGEAGFRAARSVPSPWPDFVDSVRPHVASLVASHRPEHRLSGALHKETNYGRPYDNPEDGKQYAHFRKPLTGLSVSEIGRDGENGAIVDPAARDAVRAKLAQLGWTGNPASLKTAQSRLVREDPATLPAVGGSPVWSVRLRKPMSDPLPLGSGPRERTVESDSIHHVEIFARRKNGKDIWDSSVVTLAKAYERRRRRQPVIARRSPEDPEAEFLFSLMKGDLVELRKGERTGLTRCKKFQSNGQIWFHWANDARKDAEQDSWSLKPNTMRAANVRKVLVGADGTVTECHD